MEKVFKTLFALGVIVFCILIIGLFLLALKIILLFKSPLHIFGMIIQ